MDPAVAIPVEQALYGTIPENPQADSIKRFAANVEIINHTYIWRISVGSLNNSNSLWVATHNIQCIQLIGERSWYCIACLMCMGNCMITSRTIWAGLVPLFPYLSFINPFICLFYYNFKYNMYVGIFDGILRW